MKLLRSLLRLFADEQGVGSIYLLCLLPVFLMFAGLGIDGTAAFRTRDMLQSTADASAIAAALKLPVGGTASTAQQCGSVNSALQYAKANMSVAGFGNVLNAAYTSSNVCTHGDVIFGTWNGTTFSSATAGNAVQVTVKTATANSNPYPTTFLAFIGKSSWDIVATAVAVNGTPKPICVLTLAGNFVSHGGPSTDLTGCVIASNGNMTCTGHDLGADYGVATGTNNGCGNTQESNQPAISDPYASLASNISSSALPSCGGTFNGQSWNSAPVLTTTPLVVCGNLNLTGNVQLSPASGGSVIIIENGTLNTGSGYTLSTSNTNGLTIVFSGTAGNGAVPAPTGTGTIDFNGPTSGTWKNIALYDDPALSAYSFTESGSQAPTWDISGIVYLPKASITIKGAINKSNNGFNCFDLVANDITIDGTGNILAEGACSNSPTTLVPISRLVQ